MLRQAFVLIQMDQRSSGGNYPAIIEEELRKVVVPLPSIYEQQSIVQILNDAYKDKARKEAQANANLAQIDTYLLAELGIMLPIEDDRPQSRIFTVRFADSTGKRFDPLFFYRNFLDQIPTGQYPVEPLGRHVSYFQTGFAAGKADQSTDETDVIQIRPTNFSPDRELIFDRNVFIHRPAVANRPADVLQPGEVLFNNTNSQELVGKSALFTFDDDYFCSNHVTRIGTAHTLHSEYLTHLFNLYQRQKVFFRVCTNWNNQSGVNSGVLAAVPIPVPPLKKQSTIAETIDALRAEAHQLRHEARQGLEAARQEVERIILAA